MHNTAPLYCPASAAHVVQTLVPQYSVLYPYRRMDNFSAVVVVLLLKEKLPREKLFIEVFHHRGPQWHHRISASQPASHREQPATSEAKQLPVPRLISLLPGLPFAGAVVCCFVSRYQQSDRPANH